MDITILLLPLYALIYPITYGFCEACYFHFWNLATVKFGRNIDHKILTAIRILFAFPLVWYMYDVSVYSVLITSLFILFLLFSFPFLHDGFYYITRNKIYPGTYPDGWKQNINSRAVLDINYTWRVIMFIVAILIYTVIQICNGMLVQI